jgi:hypothetical protein
MACTGAISSQFTAPATKLSYADGSFGVEIPALDEAARGIIQPGVSSLPTAALERLSSEEIHGFLDGVFDAIGDFDTRSVTLAWNSLPWLQTIQRMLLRFGVASTIRNYDGYRLRVTGSNLQALVGGAINTSASTEKLLEDIFKVNSSLRKERFLDQIVSLEEIAGGSVFATANGIVADGNGFVILL